MWNVVCDMLVCGMWNPRYLDIVYKNDILLACFGPFTILSLLGQLMRYVICGYVICGMLLCGMWYVDADVDMLVQS